MNQLTGRYARANAHAQWLLGGQSAPRLLLAPLSDQQLFCSPAGASQLYSRRPRFCSWHSSPAAVCLQQTVLCTHCLHAGASLGCSLPGAAHLLAKQLQHQKAAHKPQQGSLQSRRCSALHALADAPPQEAAEAAPAELPPARPLSPVERLAALNAPRRRPPCRRCAGSGTIPCSACAGAGTLGPGGYHKRNTLDMARIVGSKWTAMQRMFGWRHFRCVQRRREGKLNYLLMVSTCDESVRFWVNAANLRDRGSWAAGWLQRVQLQALLDGAPGGGAACRTCAHSGRLPCPLCKEPGAVINL